MTVFEEDAKKLDYEDWFNKYENELEIYWYELGCNYEVGNELEDFIENIYASNGGFDT